MEVADIVCLASPGGLARVVFVNEKQLSAALHGFARLWIAVLILVPTALAATQLWLAIEHRDHSKVSAQHACPKVTLQRCPPTPIAVSGAPRDVACS